ncbi:hypothetical protein METBIDRAFT_111907 [Metschnikowia bicuspidata var. bicuspidata NRRL YB-4993]|uniref:Uncharacterized protein n=1 Tax=Metschnikowia bicuspidata var. bicuspidata NRRL YB-4993 TaxID=869754 RepID=A0A1A0HIR2_9ASCO|nr:hypothetical protein METBIDRAFT_111907 [Metschnikowia bicuspidata var. bicuspidata NRRL YB-4993]OBA23728.1 hypothetical protein METBIDRAFT_111907 [Metschnikowia bicuspidata var. bicuspidata NRRL YB-4993]
MSSRPKKNTKARAPPADKDAFRARREASFQLHDEADLVNFRADALSRYISNQRLLDNVALSLVHTAQIVPPPSFPSRTSGDRLYAESASDAELEAAVRGLKAADLYSGDLRLMRAKQRVLAQELAAAELRADGVLGPEARFQRDAVATLAAAQARCADADSLAALESALADTLEQARVQFGRRHELRANAVRKYAVAAHELAPGAVQQAPAGYDARRAMVLAAPGPMHDARYADGYMAPEYPEFGMLADGRGPGGADAALPFDPQLALAMLAGEAYLKESAGGAVAGHPDGVAPGHEAMGAAVDMDDIDQYLADPDAGDDMDDMHALMDFDGPGKPDDAMPFGLGPEPGAADLDDDPFGVDFLSLMGPGME